MSGIDPPEPETPTAEEIAFARFQLARYRRRLRSAGKGLEEARRALYGPPPTEDELAEARCQIAAQQARDEGKGGLF